MWFLGGNIAKMRSTESQLYLYMGYTTVFYIFLYHVGSFLVSAILAHNDRKTFLIRAISVNITNSLEQIIHDGSVNIYITWAPSKASVVSLSKKLYSNCLVPVGSRNGFERDLNLNLTSCSAVQSLECKVHNLNLIALLIFNIQTQYRSHNDSMSLNAWINVAYKRKLPKDVEYAAVCGFGSPPPKQNLVEKNTFWFVWVLGKLGWSVNLKIKNLWPQGHRTNGFCAHSLIEECYCTYLSTRSRLRATASGLLHAIMSIGKMTELGSTLLYWSLLPPLGFWLTTSLLSCFWFFSVIDVTVS